MDTTYFDIPEEYKDLVHFTNKLGIKTGYAALIEWVKCYLRNGVYEVVTTSNKTVYIKNIDGEWVEVRR